jgi:pimeloyl-ACP methyl ester carboxylesterase
MGGAIALQYALNYPDELRGIILLGTGARLRVHPHYLDRARNPGENNADWLAGHLKYYKRVQPDIYQVVEQRAGQIGPMVELNDLMACDRFDVMEQVQDITLPAQVICGSEDAMTPVKYADYLAENIDGARKAIIPDGTHFVQMEKYQQVNEVIEGFLASLK